MLNNKIPKICRDCKYCDKTVPISDWMPEWISWEYKCTVGDSRKWDFEKDDYICDKKETCECNHSK